MSSKEIRKAKIEPIPGGFMVFDPRTGQRHFPKTRDMAEHLLSSINSREQRIEEAEDRGETPDESLTQPSLF